MKKKILVVDNHVLMLKFMTTLLEKEGYQVRTAIDGIAALEILKTYVPNVIFLDLIMPNISGDKLCSIIRKMPKLNAVYLVIISAIAAEEKNINIADFGADACIAKCSFNKLSKHVLATLAQAEIGNPTLRSSEIMGLGEIHSREITAELLSLKHHFEIILDSISEGILEITLDAKIVYANPVAVSLTGIPEENLLASNFLDLFDCSNREKICGLLENNHAISQKSAEDSIVLLNDKQIEVKILPLRENEFKAIVILSNVTEKIRRETQLRQAHKMEAIGTLSAGIAHDFNNLLMGIQGNTSLMILDITSRHPHHEKLKRIEKLVQSGSKLTSQLLGYARKGRYKVKPLCLNSLVEETSETFARAKKEITIHREFCDELAETLADKGQIEQVLLNLYVNAANAMPTGGGLVLKTQNATHKDMAGALYNPRPGAYVLLTVTDTGIGMEKETMQRIFDPFFTTKQMGHGTGLGLASVYGIIKGHGGYIDVESQKNHGTTFKIYLPAIISKEKTKHVKIKQTVKNTESKETVLLVDDEEITQEVAQEILTVMGYKVLIAKGGHDAIEAYKKHCSNIGLVILDMVMPNMGGKEVYERLKKINPEIKVLLSSGYSLNGEATAIMQRGCNGFIQKPFTMKELSQSMRTILNGNNCRH
ncbi:MAG: response regulator [Desulfobacterales bacterium]|nr:response regulator [Desulfobacterales bacterium]